MKSILLVEDDRNIAASLSAYLRSENYRVEICENLTEARSQMKNRPSMVILDWTLPDGQGLDLLKELRQHGNDVPVILLTARTELIDKVLALESGASDYLTKPFEPRELVARIRVRLRESIRPSASFVFAGIRLDDTTRLAEFNGETVDLTKLEFDLLKLLIESPGRVFTREMILNKVWGYDCFPTTRTVDNHIVQLRQKMDPAIFETVRGVGYRLVECK